jgi:acetyl-CoA C-acetyltransferase
VPDHVGCVTINKVCGSGLKAVMLAAQAIRAGDAEIVVLAGGMESMSNVPYLLPQARTGYRLGNGTLVDGLMHDGLWDPYNNFHMGSAGELCARECQIPRERQDEYAADSYRRAQAAVEGGQVPRRDRRGVEVPSRKGPPTAVDDDEQPFKGDPTSWRPAPGLRQGRDDHRGQRVVAQRRRRGAGGDVARGGDRRGLTPLATDRRSSGRAQAPEWFTTAPTAAIQRLLRRTGHSVADVDLWEINEAFAVVSLVNQDQLGIPSDRLNVRGGAVALGHPIGASGARILVTLIHALRQTGKRRGVASLCIGGGEAVALMVERVGR